MAASITVPNQQYHQNVLGNLRVTIFDVVLATNDYVTNGIDFSSVLPGGTELVGAAVINSTGAGAVVQVPVVDVATKKLKLLIGAAGVNVEAANGSSTAQTVRLLALSAG